MTEPPAEKMAIFWRVGMSAKRQLAVSVGGFWLCSGQLDHTKNQKIFPGVSGLVFLSLMSYLILGNVLCFARNTTAGVGLFVAYVLRDT